MAEPAFREMKAPLRQLAPTSEIEDMLEGRTDFPPSLARAITLTADDVEILATGLVKDVEEGRGAIFVFHSTQELRDVLEGVPARGRAAGPFIGPFRVRRFALIQIVARFSS